ncbi:MAG: F0F1 ATP synthase subunit alpha, partial [Clostridia bacterium]|nr:F0F1 ATP synthase subunit alpha [Clostridia bacterium]
QYRELQSFAQFGSDLDADTMSRLEQGKRIVEVLKQNRNSPIAVELQVAIIYAVVNNMLASVPTERIHDFEDELFQYLVASRDGLLTAIRDTGVLSPESEAELRDSIETCLAKFLGNKE